LPQLRVVSLLVGDVFGFIEEIGVESLVGVEDFDADEAAVFQSSAMKPVTPGGLVAWMVSRPVSSAWSVR
jgi:hypothetical protein